MTHASRDYFQDLHKGVCAALRVDELCTLSFEAEQSDFVRFNHGRVRQAGHVEQSILTLRLLAASRHASAQCTLSGQLQADLPQVLHLLGTLRDTLGSLPQDPLLYINTEPFQSCDVRSTQLPSGAELVEQVVAASSGVDLVGFLANGPILRGFANSLGQFNWHEVNNFIFEWSLYHQADKATKHSYAGLEWDPAQFAQRMQRARAELDLLRQPARRLTPGDYRVYLAPAALAEIMDLLKWDGFSEKARRTRQSPLQRLCDGHAQLSPLVNLSEDTATGLAPAFQDDGFARPAQLPLVNAGQHAATLVSPRTAREYDLAQNGANVGGEAPLSLDMAAGSLGDGDVLAALDDGLYVNNLWYLNYSDRVNCRMTGMTRFATFWVENGVLKQPCDVMRFDDTVYRLLGSQLERITEERNFLPDSSTYLQRHTVSQRLPGVIIDGMRFTL
jgi:predicted Zn-dependent protease